MTPSKNLAEIEVAIQAKVVDVGGRRVVLIKADHLASTHAISLVTSHMLLDEAVQWALNTTTFDPLLVERPYGNGRYTRFHYYIARATPASGRKLGTIGNIGNIFRLLER